MSLEHTKWGWKARWREDGLHKSKTFPTKEEAQDFDKSVNRKRTMSEAQRYAYTRPIRATKTDTETLDAQRSRAETVRLELKEKIEEGIQRRYVMRRVKG